MATADPLDTELHALLKSLHLAWEHQLLPLEINVHAELLVNLLNTDFTNFLPLLFDCSCLLQRLGDPTVYHVYREKNKLVDSLAVLDFYNRGSIPTVWTTTFSSPPPSTLVVLCADKQEEEFLRRINIASAHSSSMYIHGSPSSFSSAPVMDVNIFPAS